MTVHEDVPPPSHPPPLLAPDALHQLCSQGYVALDLPPSLDAHFSALKDTADVFFALPEAEKDPYRSGSALGPPASPTNTERGYTRLPEEKEYITLRRSMSHLPPKLREASLPVWHDTARLMHRILSDIGCYLGLGPSAFSHVVEDSMVPDGFDPKQKPRSPKDDPPTLLRLFRYEPGGGGAERHRDLGMLTMCVCWGPGLQVLQRNAQVPEEEQGQSDPVWIDAPRVTIMTGNSLFRLSNRIIPPAIHRVVVDPAEKEAAAAEAKAQAQAQAQSQAQDTTEKTATESTSKNPQRPGRRSIVFALRATVEGEIDLTPLGGIGTVNAAAFYEAIRKQRININQGKDRREAARARLRAQRNGEAGEAGEGHDAATGSAADVVADTQETGELVGVA